MSGYGLCPVCGVDDLGASRERRPNGYTTCRAGHKAASATWRTAPKPAAGGWQERVDAEREELGQRISKLRDFLDRPDAAVITGDHNQIRLMWLQLDAMNGYWSILNRRLRDSSDLPAVEPAPAL